MSVPMEKEAAIQEKAGPHAWGWTKALPGKSKAKVIKIAKNVKKLGQDDPRIVIHSLKVGLALTLVSLLYYSRSLYDGFGVSGMWAVLTVVVVFEFTVGGTLSKSLNRGFATLVAGALGVGAQHFASLFGEKGEPIVLGLLVFLLAAASTFTRFLPKIKARYDYGVMVFILTFSLVSVSGYRIKELLTLAYQRLSTIIIGGVTCILVSVFICPVWAGEDLHYMVASNVEKLGSYLEGLGGEYIGCSEDDKSSLEEYKSVLDSKSTEDFMANLAWWEPIHGQFRFQHPWKQYLKIGALSRKCAYQIEALNGFINSDVQIQAPQESQTKIFDSCKKISEESGKALKSLASAIKTMTDPSPANFHVENSKLAIEDLKFILKAASLDHAGLLTIAPAATVASILIEIVNCVDELYKTVQELSNLAHFRSVEPAVTKENSQSLHHGSVKSVSYDDSKQVVITIHRTPADSPENESTQPPKPGRLEEV